MKKLQDWLKEKGIWFKIIDRPETVHTAEAASAAGLDLKRVAKSLVLLTRKKDPILAIIPGNCRADKQKIRDALDLSKINMAPFDKAKNYSGYEPGATPPVHHKLKMRVIIDKRLLQYKSIYGGGGSRYKLVELKPQDVVEINNAIVADIIES